MYICIFFNEYNLIKSNCMDINITCLVFTSHEVWLFTYLWWIVYFYECNFIWDTWKLSCPCLLLIGWVHSPDHSCCQWSLWGGGTTRRERSQYPGPEQCKGKHILLASQHHTYINTFIHSCWSVYKKAILYRGCTDC